jgi:hypothetical protein
VLPAPEGNLVQLHLQARGCETRDQKLIILELLTCSEGQRVLMAVDAQGLPFDAGLRRVLDRDEKPLIGFRKARKDDALPV